MNAQPYYFFNHPLPIRPLSAFGERYERFMALNYPSYPAHPSYPASHNSQPSFPAPTPCPPAPAYIPYSYQTQTWLSIPMPDMNRPPAPPAPPHVPEFPRFQNLDTRSSALREELQRRAEFDRGRHERAMQHVVPTPPPMVMERGRETKRERVEEVPRQGGDCVYRVVVRQAGEAGERRPRGVRDLPSVWWRVPTPTAPPPPVVDDSPPCPWSNNCGGDFDSGAYGHHVENHDEYEPGELWGLPTLEPSSLYDGDEIRLRPPSPVLHMLGQQLSLPLFSANTLQDRR
ncbi:hypothetical protein IAT38_004670 [Cryptococcus sp. DSM 104549]